MSNEEIARIRTQIGHMSMLITAYTKIVNGEVAIEASKLDRAKAEGRDYVGDIEVKRLVLAIDRLTLAQRLASEGVRFRLLQLYRAAATPLTLAPRVIPSLPASTSAQT